MYRSAFDITQIPEKLLKEKPLTPPPPPSAVQSQKKTTGSVYDSPRAMAKLLKEAKRVKQVLSANIDHRAQVSGRGYKKSQL